jgi:amidohydrolase
MSHLSEKISEVLPAITEIRHDLHTHPELGYEEKRTASVVSRELTALGVEHVAGLAGGTGVLGYIPATSNPDAAKTIALRADMDALPILENTGLDYASQTPGKMHACGHDGHTSILLGVAKVLSQTEHRPNNVLLVFQPAEEGGAGGRAMCRDGVLQGRVVGKPADMIYGLHGQPYLRVGEIGTCVGSMMAAADRFDIDITGKGGHAAQPHTGVDPILVGGHIIAALQSVASRSVAPLDSVVVSITKVDAGTAYNIIPDTAKLLGTLRTLKMETREFAIKRIEEIVTHVASAFGASATISWDEKAYPVTFNDADAVARWRTVLGSSFGDMMLAQDVQPTMGGEDFSFYGHEVPACFFWLGLLNPGQERYPNLHAPEFDFNDKALPFGIKALCELALSEVPLRGGVVEKREAALA